LSCASIDDRDVRDDTACVRYYLGAGKEIVMTEPSLIVSLPDAGLQQILGDVPEGVEFIVWDMSGPAPQPNIDLAMQPYLVGPQVLRELAGVTTRLVQSPMVGYDGVKENLPPGHVYANAASVHETSTAELTLALVLASQRAIPDFVRNAGQGHWERIWCQSLADRNVLLVGYGGVGQAIEARLLPFEVKLTRVAHHARMDGHGEIYGVESLPELLPAADIVIVAVPLSDDTTGLVDDAFLSLMHDGALFVNIARGPVADTDALLQHASSGRLRLALDVTDPEPLPEGHPLFALPNVLISPHVGGATSAGVPRMARLLNIQIERLLRDEEPINVVLRT
jgi:phosphoglycerate dehydrogenase-like enzyme